MNNLTLAPRLQNLVDLGESGTDILHGELKNLMLEAETELLYWQKVEEDTDYGDAMDSMELNILTEQVTLLHSQLYFQVII